MIGGPSACKWLCEANHGISCCLVVAWQKLCTGSMARLIPSFLFTVYMCTYGSSARMGWAGDLLCIEKILSKIVLGSSVFLFCKQDIDAKV